jgi:hypothetical protein
LFTPRQLKRDGAARGRVDMAGPQIDRVVWRWSLAACLAATAATLPALAQTAGRAPLRAEPSLADDLRPAAEFQQTTRPPRLSDENGALRDEVDPADALDAEARASDTGGEDEVDDPDADASTPRRPVGFDLFAEPERPASATDRPSAQAEPASPEPFSAGPARPEAPGGADPGAAGVLAAPLRGSGIDPDALGGATAGRALAARPAGRIDDARPDLFGGTPLRAESLRNPLPVTDPDDPFAALGMRAGSFMLYPTLLQTVGASSNIDAEPGSGSGLFSETTLSARLLSDWSRHEAEANASATYRRNFSGEVRDDPRLDADARISLDLGGRTGATLRGAISYRRDDPADGGEVGGSGERPENLDGTLAADLERSFGRVLLRGTGSLSRSIEESAVDGVPDERYTTATAAFRAGYELSPALQPFAEASLGRRVFDSSPAPGGDGPDATISALRTGATVRFSEKLFGEAAVGYAWSDPDEERFRETRSPTFDALLTWSPRRGTDVTLTTATRFEPGSEGLSSETVYDASLGLSHRWRARTDLDGRLVARFTDSTVPGGDETLLSFEAGVTYWLSRMAALTSLYRHEDLLSDSPGADWRADTIQFGIRLQR